MMNRRKFFARMATGIAAAALATHLTFGKLVPVLEPVVEPKLVAGVDYYIIKWPVENHWTAYHLSLAAGKVQFKLAQDYALESGNIVRIKHAPGTTEFRHEVYDKLVEPEIPNEYRLPDWRPGS
jgi:hypothetical protein